VTQPLTVRHVPAEAPWTLDLLGSPALDFVVYGTPAPQGSKSYKGHRTSKKSGRSVAVLAESSKKVKPWRNAVKAIAESLVLPEHRPLLDGALVADMVFSLPCPARFPKGKPDDTRWLHGRPTTMPDLSKLARSTEDALTGVAWADDARVVAYRRLDKVYAGADDHDALLQPGARIRIWPAPVPVMAVAQ
jgi:Holliday junction resolvase RusA-like endonuclease